MLQSSLQIVSSGKFFAYTDKSSIIVWNDTRVETIYEGAKFLLVHFSHPSRNITRSVEMLETEKLKLPAMFHNNLQRHHRVPRVLDDP